MTPNRSVRWWFVPAAALILGGGGSLLLATGPQPTSQPENKPDRGPDQQRRPKQDPNSVGAHMEAAGKLFKDLQNQVNDPAQNESSLAMVQGLEEHLIAAKKFVPEGWKDIPESDKPGMLKGFRKDLGEEVVLVLKLERQLLDGDNDKAVATLGEVKAGQKAGHKKYRREDEERGPGSPGGPPSGK